MSVLEQVAQKRVPRPSGTRWNFKSQTVISVSQMKEDIIECCSNLEKSFSSATGHAAAGIKRNKFCVLVEFFCQGNAARRNFVWTAASLRS